jgi:Mg-chelatase subunit ChlD
MNPEMPLKPQDESEAQLTALLLGELPHDQAAALHQKLAEDAELAKLYERLKQTINLVRETLATPAAQTAGQPTPLKLSDQRRQKLLQHFKTIAPKEFVPPRRRGMPWLVPVGIAAAFVVILGGLLLPAFSKAKSRGQSLTFGTLSLSESAASARLAPPVQNSTRSYQGSIRRLDQSALGAQQPSGGAPIAPALQEAAPPAKPARTAIVLPQATELADSATTPAAGGVQPGFTVSGTTKGFYDDSLGRAGGMGGGGGFGGGGMGGSGGGVRSFSIATEGQQKELAAAVEQERMQDFSELAPPPILADSSSDTLEYKADGIVPTVGPDGEPLPPAPQSQPFVYRNAYIVPPEAAKGTGTGAGAGSTARQYQNSITAGDSFFSTDAETRRVADAGTQPPVAAPALRAILAPAQETPVQAVVSQPAPGPVPAAAEPALVANSVEVAAVPFQALGKDKAAGDLTTGLQAAVPGKPAPDVSNAGELLLKRNVAGLDSANKLADAAASAGGIAEANPSFSFYMDANRNPAPATPPAGSRPAQEVELKQALAGESPPPASGSYYGGGAFGGYSSIQKLPNGGDQGVVPARPALRSPKEGGFAGGVGNAALPTAPSSPQEAAVNEAALRQANLNLSKQSDQKALGFDSYLGNSLARNGRLAAQDGTAPSEVDQVPVLGDVPLIGRLFQSTTGVSGGAVKADTTSPTTTPASGKQEGAAYFSVDPETRRMVYIADEATANHIAQVLTNLDRPNSAGNTWEFGQQGAAVNSRLGTDANGASRLAQSPIVLPAAPSEAGLALKDGKDVQLFAAANQPAATPEHPQQREEKVREAQANVDRQRTEVEGKKEIDERLLASTLNSQQANLNQVLELYGKLVNRKVLRSPSVPSAAFDIKAAASLTRDEAIQVLDSALARHGITMVNVGNDVVKALPQTQGNTAGAPLNPVISGNSEPTPEETPKPAAPAPIPQPEVQTTDNAFSTFSLNVSDVSFKLAAASLEKGVMPEPATVRSEEFINAFDYRDPEPPPGVPVAFAWERAQYPFAQNRDLLRFSIKTAALGRQPGRPLNIVLLLDNSGSMERADRVRIIHEALRVLAGQLQPQDIFSVVTFSRTAHLWVDGVPGNQAAQVAEEVSGLTPQGGTNLEDAMNLAYQTALRHYLANGINRVVLLTDGAANLGNVDPEALKQKVEAHRKQGVALDCFGIGWEGYNDDLLEVLSRNGDGRYAFLNSPEEAATEFAAKLAGALQVAASDVKVQVEFNPARVTAYRQIGYAKHQLTKEQFRDNTVNAAQIGAAEAGNALYTVEVNPAGTGPLCTVRVRFRIPGTADYREHAWDVPFNGNAVALEQASPAMRLAATASAFSEWLASSPYAGEVTPDRLLGYLSGVPVVYGADARPTKLEWMIRQAKSIAGK